MTSIPAGFEGSPGDGELTDDESYMLAFADNGIAELPAERDAKLAQIATALQVLLEQEPSKVTETARTGSKYLEIKMHETYLSLLSGEIVQSTDTSVTLGLPHGIQITMRRGSLGLPSPDGSLVSGESNKPTGLQRIMKLMGIQRS